MKNKGSENMRWLYGLFWTMCATQLISALIGLADDEVVLHGGELPVLTRLHAADERGLTLIIPAIIALAWAIRLIRKRHRA